MNMTTEPNEPINNAGKAANGQPYNRIDMEYIETTAMLIGLTKREYFAAMAMQGILSNPNTPQKVITDEIGLLGIASFACKSADALIEALNKQ